MLNSKSVFTSMTFLEYMGDAEIEVLLCSMKENAIINIDFAVRRIVTGIE